MGIERKFLTPEDVEKIIKTNPDICSLINKHKYAEILWSQLPRDISDLINAERIMKDDISLYKSPKELIRASNQFFWAYCTVNPQIYKPPEIVRYAREVIKIIWDLDLKPKTLELAQDCMRKSLDLAEKATQKENFKPEDFQYILSSYIQGGLRTEGRLEDSLLERYITKMISKKGVIAAMDFFDEYISDGMLSHPFYQASISLDEPYYVKSRFLDQLLRKYEKRTNKNDEYYLRISRTLLNFNSRAIEEIIYKGNLQEYFRYAHDKESEGFTNLRWRFNKKGMEFVQLLKKHGYNDQLINSYINAHKEEFAHRYQYRYQKEFRSRQHEYSESRFVSNIANLNEALKILGFDKIPDQKKIVQRVYWNLIKIWHPDLCNLPNGEEMTKRINNAWETIEHFYNNN